MSFKNTFGIYQVLERLLKAANRPLTCVELFDAPEVRQLAPDVNRVSDYLGHMYRRALRESRHAVRSTEYSARGAPGRPHHR